MKDLICNNDIISNDSPWYECLLILSNEIVEMLLQSVDKNFGDKLICYITQRYRSEIRHQRVGRLWE